MTTVLDLLNQHPTNPVDNTGYVTQSNKEWTRQYHPIDNLVVHTQVGADDGMVYADFDSAFVGMCDDDTLRMTAPAVAPNKRTWRLESEADCELWFHTEVSNVVLAAWDQYCGLTQTSHTKPPRVASIAEEVDATYTLKYGDGRTVIAIGEMKRNLIRPNVWQAGDISGIAGQRNLSRELRGYADKYQSPQVFCFDGDTLLLLQFRARKVENIRGPDCHVDCWVFPREYSAIPLRWALYRLLAQGFRRFQGMCATPVQVGGLTPRSRLFYNGWPLWRVAGGAEGLEHLGGYQRLVDAESGAVKWANPENADDVVWETPALWGVHAQQ